MALFNFLKNILKKDKVEDQKDEIVDFVNLSSWIKDKNKELKNKGMPLATRYTAQDPSIRVQQPQIANSNVAISMIDALSQNTAGGQRKAIAVGGDQARQASNVRTAIDNAKAKGESTIDVSMASKKNPYSARELGMNR